MVRGGKGHADPLVTKSGLTTVEIGGQKYLCTFTGANGREQLSVAKVVSLMGDQNDANLMARRFCDKGRKTFVGIDTERNVYVAEELPPKEVASIKEQILAQRQPTRRTGEFARFQQAGGSEPIVVDYTQWAEGIALQYVDMPVDTMRINAVNQLPGLSGTDQKRTALITALGTVADICDNNGRATVIRKIAGELAAGTLVL
ncbi:MAG: hypothetical protein ABID61_00775 [Candidatus Micrarchaeota archaeon]